MTNGKRKKRIYEKGINSEEAPVSAKKSRTSGDSRDDKLQELKELKKALTSDNALPEDFLDRISSLNKDPREEVYRTISSESDKGKELLKKMDDSQLGAWAESLGQAGRAVELGTLLSDKELFPKGKTEDIPRLKRGTKASLLKAFLVLQRVIGDKDQGPKGGGVGAPGFTKENTKKAGEIDAKAAHEYIAKTILGSEGENLRAEIRKDPSDANKKEAADMIRKIKYSEALPNEMHAIGLGNDVLAASWVEGIRYASPYQQIAREIDEIAEKHFSGNHEKVAKIIAQYAGMPITSEKLSLTTNPKDDFSAKLREFATIQIAEKGREIKRAKEAGDIADKKLVEEALKNAGKEGFYNVYVRNTREKAPFAAEGGQQRLRELYNPVKSSR